MAKKKEINVEIADIKRALDEGKLIIGTERVIKALKRNDVEKVFYAVNTAEDSKLDLSKYSNAFELEITNEDLGVLCKKPFSISMVGISKSD